jgi:hypothetical protein
VTFQDFLQLALASGFVTWGVIKTELRYLRRDVDAAHRRLDRIGAPSAGSAQGAGE